MSGDLEVRRVGADDGHVRLAVSGELDLASAGELRKAVDGHLAERAAKSLELDMSAVSFIDSSGLNALIAIHRCVDEHGGGLVVRSPSRTVRRLFEITAIDRVITVED